MHDTLFCPLHSQKYSLHFYRVATDAEIITGYCARKWASFKWT